MLAVAGLGACVASRARAQPQPSPAGAALVRMLGPRARDAFAPRSSPGMGALVRLPVGGRAADYGLAQAAPGFARLWGPPSAIVAFADAHPELPVEVAPPLHLLLDTATTYVASTIANESGLDGTGVLVGIADTGIDVTHPDFLDAQGHTRVAWLLDLSSPPIGKHPDLEQEYGSTDSSGNLVAGAVWSAADIDPLLDAGQLSQLPQDPVGHGTLVSACAAGNGLQGRSLFRGVAPNATLVVARITGTDGESIGNDELLRGVKFLFDRADALGQPVVVNLSIGTDFGPHDGTMAWEQTLASYVGPGLPGHALVAAAGNSGSIAETPVHQNVHVNPSTTMRVPLLAPVGALDGGVQVWVAMHAGANLSVGLDGPDGTWISPVGGNDSAGKNTSDYDAGVYNGSGASGSPVPSASNGAVVVWQGHWPSGTYQITLEGSGTADLYVQGTGDAASAGSVGWASGVRESTINLPATHPAILGVGCSINKTSWDNIHRATLALGVPELDAAGDAPDPSGAQRAAVEGEPCWFSSAGPTLTGVQKPEILAPGAAIVGALSQQAVPPSPTSIFTNPSCPDASGTGTDPACQQVDALHGASFGTSFSAPLASGAIAILLQRDPTLTQDQIVAALQGGAHPLRGPAPFLDQQGAGELDVMGAVAAAEQLRDPVLAIPASDRSWIVLGGDVFLADGSTPMQAILELRAEPAGGSAAPADGFAADRLAVYALIDDAAYDGAVTSLARRGPGVWVATLQLPAGLGGTELTVGATFDGRDVVLPRSIPIATDSWDAGYPARVQGGCAVGGGTDVPWAAGTAVLLALVAGRRRSTAGTSGPGFRARTS